MLFSRLTFPSIERELRAMLTETADSACNRNIRFNLKALLLQPPMANKIIMGIDPGFYSGQK